MTDFSATKSQFQLPEGVIYLDGNSLGPLPKKAIEHVNRTVVDEWGEMLIKGWNEANWMHKPMSVGERIGNMLGASPETVVLGDTLSIKVYQALAAAIDLAGDRKKIMSDTGNFPTDLYMAEGLIRTLDRDYELVLKDPEEIEASLDESIAVLMLTHVDYRTGRMHDMNALTKKAQELGIITIWDLAHSAGAVPVDLEAANADFAVGCTYKYLNSGPGGPAFIYIAPRHQDKVKPALAGWQGHDAPFAFELNYRAGPAISRMRVGTPPIIQIAALEASLDIWDQVEMADIRAKSIELCDLFIELVEQQCPEFKLASPRDSSTRGSQVSFSFDEGYAVMQAIIDRGVIGDFRAPDIMRFGFTPLYIDEGDVRKGVEIIAEVMKTEAWKEDKYRVKKAVT